MDDDYILSNSSPDPYKILGITKDAKLSEIRSAHRKLALKCHPDRVEDETLKRVKQDEFQQVQQAYELLSDDYRRSKYDELFELRKKLQLRTAGWEIYPRPNRFEHELGTGGPTSYERSIPDLSVRATVAPKSHDNVPDERVRDPRKRSTSHEMAGDGDQKQHFEERAKRTLRSYGIQALPRSSVFKEDMKRVRDTAKLRLEQLRDERIIESLSKPISRLPRPEPSPKVYPRSQNTEEVIAPGPDVPSRRFRRGRGARQVVGVNGSDDPNDPVC
jgi:curved DNA-binding protein CbpA